MGKKMGKKKEEMVLRKRKEKEGLDLC